MQIETHVQELKREIAALEADNLELLHELELANARFDLMRVVAQQLVAEVAIR